MGSLVVEPLHVLSPLLTEGRKASEVVQSLASCEIKYFGVLFMSWRPRSSAQQLKEKEYLFRLKCSEIIRKAREQMGVSQGQFARLIKVSEARLKRFESGALSPDAFEWMEICRIADIPVDSISSIS